MIQEEVWSRKKASMEKHERTKAWIAVASQVGVGVLESCLQGRPGGSPHCTVSEELAV